MQFVRVCDALPEVHVDLSPLRTFPGLTMVGGGRVARWVEMGVVTPLPVMAKFLYMALKYQTQTSGAAVSFLRQGPIR